MKSDITRRDALALGASAAALAATGAAAQGTSQGTSNVKAADVAAPSLPIEKGATLRTRPLNSLSMLFYFFGTDTVILRNFRPPV